MEKVELIGKRILLVVLLACFVVIILNITGVIKADNPKQYKQRDNVHINMLAIAYFCEVNGIDSGISLKHFYIENYFLHVDKNGNVHKSHKGALGVGQLMPNTAKYYNVDPEDKIENIKGSVECLAELMRYFRNRKLAVSAYNAGISRVNKYKRRGKKLPDETINHWRKISEVDMDKILSFAREYDGV